MKNVALFFAIAMIFSSDAASQSRSRLYEDGITEIRVYVPSMSAIGYSGSYEQHINTIANAPAIEVRIMNKGKRAEFFGSTSADEKKPCEFREDEDPDALIYVFKKAEASGSYLLFGRILYDRESHACFNAPPFLIRIANI